jgi:hypothetical protein
VPDVSRKRLFLTKLTIYSLIAVCAGALLLLPCNWQHLLHSTQHLLLSILNSTEYCVVGLLCAVISPIYAESWQQDLAERFCREDNATTLNKNHLLLIRCGLSTKEGANIVQYTPFPHPNPSITLSTAEANDFDAHYFRRDVQTPRFLAESTSISRRFFRPQLDVSHEAAADHFTPHTYKYTHRFTTPNIPQTSLQICRLLTDISHRGGISASDSRRSPAPSPRRRCSRHHPTPH